MREIEKMLVSRWRCSIKNDSRMLLSAHGCEEPEVTDIWVNSPTMPILGAVVSADGSCLPDWLSCERAMWRAFYARPAKRLRHAAANIKLKALDAAAWPVLAWRCSCWAPNRNVLTLIDRCQRKMISILIKSVRQPDETDATYVMRANRTAAHMARQCGRWSRRVCVRILNWSQHVARDRNSACWPHKLSSVRDEAWLQRRRIESNSHSAVAGRTGTRSLRMKIHTRWHEGLAFIPKWLTQDSM